MACPLWPNGCEGAWLVDCVRCESRWCMCMQDDESDVEDGDASDGDDEDDEDAESGDDEGAQLIPAWCVHQASTAVTFAARLKVTVPIATNVDCAALCQSCRVLCRVRNIISFRLYLDLSRNMNRCAGGLVSVLLRGHLVTWQLAYEVTALLAGQRPAAPARRGLTAAAAVPAKTTRLLTWMRTLCWRMTWSTWMRST